MSRLQQSITVLCESAVPGALMQRPLPFVHPMSLCFTACQCPSYASRRWRSTWAWHLSGGGVEREIAARDRDRAVATDAIDQVAVSNSRRICGNALSTVVL